MDDRNTSRREFVTAAGIATVAAAMTGASSARAQIPNEGQPARGNPATPMADDDIRKTLERMADGYVQWVRAPIFHRPEEASLAYEEISFPSEDGTPLEAWFIPRTGSNKILIANHPRWFNRAGIPSHLEPWKSLGGPGNDYDVNFIPDYKILHDAGYNILTYDLRNFGQSGAANGGVYSAGRYESRDVIGSLNYVRSRPDLRGMTIGLFSRCVGCNATMFAMTRRPADFDGVRCMVSPQPISSGVGLERAFERLGIDQARMAELNQLIQLRTSFTIDQFSPALWAKNVRIPTFLYQVRDDTFTKPRDVQSIFDNIPIAEKKLYWIEGTTSRWRGYTYFQKSPDQMLAFFDRYMS